MRERPRGSNEDEYGCVMIGGAIDLKPEYPEVIEWDKEYADECDRLSQMEAKKAGRRRWGRWYLDEQNNALVTPVCIPNIGEDGYVNLYEYDIPLSRLSEDWVGHMREKNWLGEKGLQDLIGCRVKVGAI